MTRGLWRDADRYLKTYWARWDNVWVHGDWAVRDEDGFWFLHGRSDDTLNVAGKRVGPAEVEAALTAHDAVIEAAVVGVPDPVRGEALCCYCVIAPDHGPTDVLRAELADLVVQRMGKPFRPRMVRFVTALPKTRSAKVVRRAIRAIAMGEDPGDISTLEDPGALSAVRNPR
jgi:acetyl-CoA synthetase